MKKVLFIFISLPLSINIYATTNEEIDLITKILGDFTRTYRQTEGEMKDFYDSQLGQLHYRINTEGLEHTLYFLEVFHKAYFAKVLIKSEEYKRYIQTIKKSSPKSETK